MSMGTIAAAAMTTPTLMCMLIITSTAKAVAAGIVTNRADVTRANHPHYFE